MADDLLGGVLGGEDEQPETEAPQALAGAEAFAAAVAARLSGNDPGVARKTETFLDEQARLLETQRRHLEEEHASRLTQLRLTLSAARRKRYADHVRNCLYTAIALLVLGVLAAATRMTVEAMRDHSLVVEDFTVPSDFAARIATGQALAEDLANRVAAISATVNRQSINRSSEVHADQPNTLKVQIPETGISVDELEGFLHRWLGHQTLVNGELREGAGDQIYIVLHIAGADPIAVQGSSADLDRLVQTTAEKAFGVFDPHSDVIYLAASGRLSEAYDAALRYAQSVSASASSQDRAEAYALLARVGPDRRQALGRALIAIDIDPHLLVVWMGAAAASSDLGHEEAAVDFARKAVETRRQDQPVSQRDGYPWIIAEGHGYIDRATGDFAALQRDFEVFDQRAEVHPVSDSYAERAEFAAWLHDEAAAREDLARALAAGPADRAVLEAHWDVSAAAGDWAQALAAAKALVAAVQTREFAAWSNDLTAHHPESALETEYLPWLAYAEVMTGDAASATALVSQTPADCDLCVHMRAKVAAAAGDVATSDRWFAEAVRQAPDLPMAYYEWGEALLARGDLAGAAREFSLAHDKGPHFADPLKGWGDVLVKQGHPKDALAKYDEALEYAPSWLALKQARDAAAKQRD